MFNRKTHQEQNRQSVAPAVLTFDQLDLVAGGLTPPVGSIGPTPPIGPIGPVMPTGPVIGPVHIKMPVV